MLSMLSASHAEHAQHLMLGGETWDLGRDDQGVTTMPRVSFRRAIAEDIAKRIRAGEYKPGDRLPTQPALAAHYRCSLEPVKRALEDLERDGWTYTQQGKGTFVADHPPGSAAR